MMKNETNTTDGQIVKDIKTLMDGWNTIEAAAKAQFKGASKSEIYDITKGAMDHALGWGKKKNA